MFLSSRWFLSGTLNFESRRSKCLEIFLLPMTVMCATTLSLVAAVLPPSTYPFCPLSWTTILGSIVWANALSTARYISIPVYLNILQTCLSFACHRPVMCLSQACHVLVMCLSCVCHMFVCKPLVMCTCQSKPQCSHSHFNWVLTTPTAYCCKGCSYAHNVHFRYTHQLICSMGSS